MSYDVIRLASDKLSYREKMKLAQYLIQAAMREEEQLHPKEREVEPPPSNVTAEGTAIELVPYVKERLLKSKPAKSKSLRNFIGAMFQFQGGIDDAQVDALIESLISEGFLHIADSKVSYEQ